MDRRRAHDDDPDERHVRPRRAIEAESDASSEGTNSAANGEGAVEREADDNNAAVEEIDFNTETAYAELLDFFLAFRDHVEQIGHRYCVSSGVDSAKFNLTSPDPIPAKMGPIHRCTFRCACGDSFRFLVTVPRGETKWIISISNRNVVRACNRPLRAQGRRPRDQVAFFEAYLRNLFQDRNGRSSDEAGSQDNEEDAPTPDRQRLRLAHGQGQDRAGSEAGGGEGSPAGTGSAAESEGSEDWDADAVPRRLRRAVRRDHDQHAELGRDASPSGSPSVGADVDTDASTHLLTSPGLDHDDNTFDDAETGRDGSIQTPDRPTRGERQAEEVETKNCDSDDDDEARPTCVRSDQGQQDAAPEVAEAELGQRGLEESPSMPRKLIEAATGNGKYILTMRQLGRSVAQEAYGQVDVGAALHRVSTTAFRE